MARLTLYNEFGESSMLLAIEPASKCIAHCTYCFAELSRRKQWGEGKRSHEDPGTFESTIEKATGPNYDPTDLPQWAIRNRIPISYANTVEPFQDLAQAAGILKTCDTLGLPLVVQTKGINFDEVWPTLKSMRDNIALFVSMGTDDDRAIRRFEPSTPLSAERWRIMEMAADAGIDVILAMAPYHEDLCEDPRAMVRRAKSIGVECVFFDHLRLHRRQREAATDAAMVKLATKEWDAKAYAHAEAIYRECIDQGLDYINNHGEPITTGCFPTRDEIAKSSSFKDGGIWPYYDIAFHNAITDMYLDLPEHEPLLAFWADIIGWIERDTKIDQVFSRTSVSSLMAYNGLSPAWKSSLGEYAPAREYLRAFFNTGKRGQFVWSHPYVRMAVHPDGSPWTDLEGNLVVAYDPFNHVGKGDRVVVEDPGDYRSFSFEKVGEESHGLE